MAGPISRVAWNTAAFSAIAARSWPGGTTSATNACLAGASNAKISPLSERERVDVGRAYRAGDRDDGQRRGSGGVQRLRGQQDAPLRQPVGQPPGVQAEQQYRQELQRHRHADAVELCVRSNTSQSWAMLCIHVPVLARLWPPR